MIVQIGRAILVESCRQMVTWQQRFGVHAPGFVCVNVSSRQFVDGDGERRRSHPGGDRLWRPTSSSRLPKAPSSTTCRARRLR